MPHIGASLHLLIPDKISSFFISFQKFSCNLASQSTGHAQEENKKERKKLQLKEKKIYNQEIKYNKM